MIHVQLKTGPGYSHQFVDTFLVQNPTLLNSLLIKATAVRRDFEEYAGLSSAQAFFMRVFETAKHDPCVNTLQPVYFMLNGACGDVSNLLSREQQEHIDQVLSNILSSEHTIGNHMLMLWCFGIALLLENAAEAASSQHHRSSSGRSPRKDWKTASGRKVFGSTEKQNKMIFVTCTSVMLAIKRDAGISVTDASEAIRIAICALRSADQKAFSTWLKLSAKARDTFEKLPLKILQANLNPTVQLEVLCFHSMLVEPNALSADLVNEYERCLDRIADMTNLDYLGEIVSISLPIYASRMQQSCFQTILSQILDACLLPIELHRLTSLQTLVESLTNIIPSCESMRTKMMSAVSDSDMRRQIWKIVDSVSPPGSNACSSYHVLLQQQMTSATIALLLTLALTTQSTDGAMPLELSIALITRQRKLSVTQSPCAHRVSYPEHFTVSLFQQKNTPYTGQHLHDWRERLKSDIESQTSFQQDSIVRSVAQICQDLETRCNTVEEPLRREREKTQELERRQMALNERITSLEVQAADNQFHSEGLEDEKLLLSDERDEAVAQLKRLEADIDEANRQADALLRQVREDYDAKQTELQSTLITLEDKIHCLENETENQSSTIDRARDDLACAEHERAVLRERLETLQEQMEEMQSTLSSKLATERKQGDEIAQLHTEKSDLQLRLQRTEVESNMTAARLSEVEAVHRELVQSSGDAYRNLELKCTHDMEAVAARAQIPPLQEKIEELKEMRAVQESELEELRTLRENVLASVGLTSRGERANQRAQTGRAIREPRRRKSALQGASSDSQSSHNGSTPKRHKTGSCYDRASAAQIPWTQKPVPSAPYASVSKNMPPLRRAALGQLSPNRRHTTVGFTASDHEEDVADRMRSARKRRGSLQAIDEADSAFGTEDFLAGTPFTPGNYSTGTGRVPDDQDDATATEL
ncbi:hypothetical protein ACEQ8H_004363 [Pleosporales sp. CAS-2024a]